MSKSDILKGFTFLQKNKNVSPFNSKLECLLGIHYNYLGIQDCYTNLTSQLEMKKSEKTHRIILKGKMKNKSGKKEKVKYKASPSAVTSELSRTYELIQHLFPKGIQIKMHLEKDIWNVEMKHESRTSEWKANSLPLALMYCVFDITG